MQYQLLTRPDSQPKAIKGEKYGVLTFVMHLAPARESGHNVCASASPGCTNECIFKQGRGVFISTRDARIRRTLWFFADRPSFMARLVLEITKAIRYAKKRGMVPAFRLNATSDIPWHRIPVSIDGVPFDSIIAAFPTVQFYDYTKISKRMFEHRPANYHLTFSLSETNWDQAIKVKRAGGNVAVVFRNKAMVSALLERGEWESFPVCSGDDSDVRFRDPANSWVLLYAKGTGRRDATGFVRDLAA
jgi:hypothetical protein